MSAAPTPGTADLNIRRNGKDLSAEERKRFVDAVRAEEEAVVLDPGLSVYDTFVLWHWDAFGCAVMAAHMGVEVRGVQRETILGFNASNGANFRYEIRLS